MTEMELRERRSVVMSPSMNRNGRIRRRSCGRWNRQTIS